MMKRRLVVTHPKNPTTPNNLKKEHNLYCPSSFSRLLQNVLIIYLGRPFMLHRFVSLANSSLGAVDPTLRFVSLDQSPEEPGD